MAGLVGRQREIEAINESLTALVNGSGGTLFFAGEPGIGKSTLARYLADEAHEQSLPVYWGFCWESGGAPAYWPWAQSLRSLVASLDVGPQTLTRLGRLLPENVDNDDQPDLQPDQARFQLIESTRLALEQITQTGPVILLLEDLHAADTDSLHLLQYLARHAMSMRLLLVGTYREIEARRSPETAPLWQATRDARVLPLARLDEHAVREYLQTTRASAPDADQVRNLFNTTEGNPLFLSELVSFLEQGREGSLPDTVQQVISQQIALLPTETANALSEAAVLGREFHIAALAALRDTDEHRIALELESAVESGLVHAVQPGRFRFSHALHREVLYDGLGTTARQELHIRCAGYIRKLIDAGSIDRWPAYATHLQAAGSDYRNEAIEAWEKSAERAHEQLAFDDAARSLQNALALFGDGPKFDPAELCALQLNYALALVLSGNIEAGQAYCLGAFETARTLGDTSLMAKAALAYGDALVVGRIDKRLIGMLRECLDALSPDDIGTRACVQARLAAALQPAEVPTEPMAMARDAIDLARTTDDETTLFAVLRSAISALMDFAPASERIPLNREFEALAEKRGNVAGQFRSNLRLIFDALEIGDRPMLDAAIDAAEHIGNRIDLPHYQWRVASARALQCMIDGRFDHAMQLIDEAQQLAERVDDIEAKITLPAQRFSLLCEWDSDQATPLAEIEAQLEAAYVAGMGDTEFFVRPFIAAFSEPNSQLEFAQVLENAAVIERTFDGSDRFSLSMVGELAISVGNEDLARRAYDALAEYAGECTSLGMMGCCWRGPVSYTLGIIDQGLGRAADARRHFETALGIATRMRAQPVVGRIHKAMADLAYAAGDQALATEHQAKATRIFGALSLREVARAPRSHTAVVAPQPAQAVPFATRLDGDIRVVTYGGKSVSLKDNKGLQILTILIATPDKDIHVLDLVGSATTPDSGDAGSPLDDKARREYKLRIGDLQDELDDAQALGDSGRADVAREEIDFITRELSRAYGLGGRERRSGSAAERARVNVRRRVKDAIDRVGEQLPEAGKYLRNTIKTGSYCRYSPM